MFQNMAHNLKTSSLVPVVSSFDFDLQPARPDKAITIVSKLDICSIKRIWGK
jgi:hypothetical protein